MHSHHSHSGTYVSHAADDLESIVRKAQSMGFTHFCLTEHMPRLENKFLYPEEIEKNYSIRELDDDFKRYLEHAKKLQDKYNAEGRMKILIGFEVEGIDESHIEYSSKTIIKENPYVNMSVGSVHYVNQIPIDFSSELWKEARDSTLDKTTRSLYKAYFDLQYNVVLTLKPPVVGHFDLIRLFEPTDEIDETTNKPLKDIKIESDWPDVWESITRNVKFINDYGGLFELNSAAIRKGWSSPYPKKDMCGAILKYGNGKFCLSDDSHSIAQVGLNFHKAWEYARDVLNLDYIYYLDLDENMKTVTKRELVLKLDKSKFWDQYK